MRPFGDARDVFFTTRFGMFIHWGLYAIPAQHEQVVWRFRYPRRDYEKLAGQFNPVLFDPEQWLDVLQGAGMEYLCFTAKHHDGFCMWDTAFTEYRVTRTPYGRDILRMLADACGRRGMRLSLYYSLPDWHHPWYPNQGRSHEMFGPRPGDAPDEARYLGYVRNQVRELCTNYGPLYQFFWDLNSAGFHDPALNDMIRELQPGILINDRGPGPGDYSTPERHVPDGLAFEKATEACQSMGRESWGYRETEDYYSLKHLMQSIDRILAMGGNYLLNVGPKADGILPAECTDGLARIGRWYRKVREAFDGTVPCSGMAGTSDARSRYDQVLLTRRGNTLYLHCPWELQTGGVVLPGIRLAPRKAVLLNDGREIPFCVDLTPWRWRDVPCLRLRNLPVDAAGDEVFVVRMEFGDDAVA